MYIQGVEKRTLSKLSLHMPHKPKLLEWNKRSCKKAVWSHKCLQLKKKKKRKKQNSIKQPNLHLQESEKEQVNPKIQQRKEIINTRV